jgi:hypothetical protein
MQLVSRQLGARFCGRRRISTAVRLALARRPARPAPSRLSANYFYPYRPLPTPTYPHRQPRPHPAPPPACLRAKHTR